MNFKEKASELVNVIKKYKDIAIIIKGSPDPDAIASAFALKAICDSIKVRSSIYTAKKISLPQNTALVKELDIPIYHVEDLDNISGHDSYAVVDFQSPHLENMSTVLPCAAHIDHHDPVEYQDSVDFKLISTEVGSTSTLLALLVEKLDINMDEAILAAVTTALLYGIQTDTDKYDHASELDYDALRFISNYYNSAIIRKISRIPLSRKTIKLLEEAVNNHIVYKDWLITGIGIIEDSNRDSIAIIADFMLKNRNISTAIVFAAVEDVKNNTMFLDASFRAKDENVNLNDIIKEITSEGGARKYKGAFQIDLNYFYHCPDKILLWEVIRTTTINILKKRRDGVYLTELRGFYNKLKIRFSNIFNNK